MAVCECCKENCNNSELVDGVCLECRKKEETWKRIAPILVSKMLNIKSNYMKSGENERT